MSVIMMMRAKGDPAAFESWANANPSLLTHIADEGKAAGCMHHMFAAGNGEIVVIDEWESAEAYEKFFSTQADIPKAMEAAHLSSEPTFMYLQKMSMPDEF
jgi:quinol monooxygenase YgiN